jgi:hypothetical protein
MAANSQGVVLSRQAPAGLTRAYRQPIYDRDILPAGPIAQVILFQRPLGQTNSAAVVKTEMDTNLTMAGQLPFPQFFHLFGFQFEVAQTAVIADMLLIYPTGVFTFTFGTNRKWLEVPMTRVPNGPQIVQNTALAAAGAYVPQFGVPSSKEFYQFVKPTGKPYAVKAGETFQVKLSWPTAAITCGTATAVRAYLVGILYVGL